MQERGQVRVYVGGPSRELDRVRHCVDALEESGLVVLTSRWFDSAEEWAGRDELLDDAEQCSRARSNFAAIRRAAIVWILWPETSQSEGASGEVGCAVAHCWHVGAARQRLVVSGRRVRSSIGTALADKRFESDGAALQHVLGSIQGRVVSARGLRAGVTKMPMKEPAGHRRLSSLRAGCVVAV